MFDEFVLRSMADEADVVFRQCPLYFEPGVLLSVFQMVNSMEEVVVCVFQRVKMRLFIDFNVSVSRMEILIDDFLRAKVNCLDGRWYSNSTIVMESAIRIGSGKSTVAYEQFDTQGRTVFVYVTDTKGFVHKLPIQTDTGRFLH